MRMKNHLRPLNTAVTHLELLPLPKNSHLSLVPIQKGVDFDLGP